MSLHSVLYIHDCNDVEVVLNGSGSTANPVRWLDIRFEDGRAQINLFFESQEDQDAVLAKLYNELGKLQPKY